MVVSCAEKATEAAVWKASILDRRAVFKDPCGLNL
jgi:hypothetical protein